MLFLVFSADYSPVGPLWQARLQHWKLRSGKMPSALKGTGSVLTDVSLSLLLASCVLGISLLSSGSSVFPNQAACAMQTSFFFPISLVICLAAMLWGLMNGDPYLIFYMVLCHPFLLFRRVAFQVAFSSRAMFLS